MDTRAHSRGLSVQPDDVDHSPATSVEVKVRGAIPPLPVYAFVARKGTTLPFSVTKTKLDFEVRLDPHCHILPKSV